MHAPGSVGDLGDAQVRTGARQRQRLPLARPEHRLDPHHHGVERIPHGDVKVGVETEGDPAGRRFGVVTGNAWSPLPAPEMPSVRLKARDRNGQTIG